MDYHDRSNDSQETGSAEGSGDLDLALTEKLSANDIFLFGREHGHYGRILSNPVVPTPALAARGEREIVGLCFTPRDGNSLLSSIAQTLRWLDRDSLDDRIECLRPYLFQEI